MGRASAGVVAGAHASRPLSSEDRTMFTRFVGLVGAVGAMAMVVAVGCGGEGGGGEGGKSDTTSGNGGVTSGNGSGNGSGPSSGAGSSFECCINGNHLTCANDAAVEACFMFGDPSGCQPSPG